MAKPIDEAMLRRLLSRYGIDDPASLAPPREGPSDVRPPPVPSGNQDVSLDWQLALRQAARVTVKQLAPLAGRRARGKLPANPNRQCSVSVKTCLRLDERQAGA